MSVDSCKKITLINTKDDQMALRELSQQKIQTENAKT